MARSATVGGAHGIGTLSPPQDDRRHALGLRARVWLLRPMLDERIRCGGLARDPNRALALRAEQLGRARARGRIAGGVDRLLDRPEPQPRWTSAVPIDLDAVEIARPELIQLTLTLRSSEPVDPRGVALAARLLSDATSPVYLTPGGACERDDEALQRLVQSILGVLEGKGEGWAR